MIDLLDKSYCPTLEEFASYVRNPAFMDFCLAVKTQFQSNEKIEFSSCSWEKGWNIKYKKAGKNFVYNLSKGIFFYCHGHYR